MSTTAQDKMNRGRAQVQQGEIEMAQAHLQNLEDQLKSVTEEGREIDRRIEETGSSLAAKHREAEPLWAQREVISRTRAALDEAFEKQDFASDEEIKQYETKRSELTGEWHQLTEKIIVLSNLIGPMEELFRQLKFARSQAVMAANDLRNVIADK